MRSYKGERASRQFMFTYGILNDLWDVQSIRGYRIDSSKIGEYGKAIGTIPPTGSVPETRLAVVPCL